MGVLKKMITNFLSNRTNLIVLQCMLYFMIGWILQDLISMSTMFVLVILIGLIQFITHIRAVASGMVYIELLKEHNKNLPKLLKKIRKESQKTNRRK